MTAKVTKSGGKRKAETTAAASTGAGAGADDDNSAADSDTKATKQSSSTGTDTGTSTTAAVAAVGSVVATKLSVADLEALSVPQLKAVLKERGLDVGGKKADLVARLQ